MTDADQDSVTVEVTVTLQDQVQFNELLLSAPDLRRIFYLRWAAAILLMPPVGLVIGVLVGFIADRSRPSLHALPAPLWEDRLSTLPVWLAVVVLMVAVMTSYRLLRRRRLRAYARLLLQERPGIDPKDRELRERARCAFGPDGFRGTGDGGEYHMRWTGVTRLDETPELLVVRTGRFTGFVLPRRDLDMEQVIAIRRIVAAHS